MAVLYLIAVELSFQLTTLPDDIPSVWFASAVSLVMVIIYQNQVLVGITIASIISIIPYLNKTEPSLSLLTYFLICVVYAVVNCLQPLISLYLLQKYARYTNIFTNLDSVWVFIVAAIFSPLICAVVGVIVLWYVEVIDFSQTIIFISRWWLASAVAHLIFTPCWLIYREKDILKITASFAEIILVGFLVYFVDIFIFWLSWSVEYLLLAVLIWGVFRLSRFYSSLLVVIIALSIIINTSNGYGVFINQKTVDESLLFLQSFIAILSITTLILTAILSEKEQTQLSLKETLETVESKVFERTKQLQQTQIDLEQLNHSLAQMVNTDGLTKIANRRCFDQQLAKEWTRLYRSKKQLCLLLIDVDYFKLYNDTYGHQQGDQCLIEIAQAFTISCMRSSDLVTRYGGEEFTILLPNTDIKGAITVAKRIQRNIDNLQISHLTSSVKSCITVSIGISGLTPDINQSPKILVEQADKALYLAKKLGRNQFQIAPHHLVSKD